MAESPEIVVTVETREGRGSAEAGRMRRRGMVPAVVYGGGKSPVPIAVEEHSIRELLKTAAGENTIFLLKLKGTDEERLAMIKELQVDRIGGHFIHIDFIRITRGHKLTVKMPVELVGDCIGVRHGGRVDFVTREIEIEILPREMFDKFVHSRPDAYKRWQEEVEKGASADDVRQQLKSDIEAEYGGQLKELQDWRAQQETEEPGN